MGQASEEVIVSVVQVGKHFQNTESIFKTKPKNRRRPQTEPPKPQKARQRSQTPAGGTGGADRKTTTTCTPRDAKMAVGAVDQNRDGS